MWSAPVVLPEYLPPHMRPPALALDAAADVAIIVVVSSTRKSTRAMHIGGGSAREPMTGQHIARLGNTGHID